MKVLIRGTCEGPSGIPENVCLSVEVLRRSHPDCHDFWDGNWVDAAIELQIPGFTAAYKCSMRTDEFEQFHQKLDFMHRCLKGTAALVTMEDGIALDGEINGRGAIAWEGCLRYPCGSFSELKFRFDSDQSYIPEMLSELEAILQEFPVIGERPATGPGRS